MSDYLFECKDLGMDQVHPIRCIIKSVCIFILRLPFMPTFFSATSLACSSVTLHSHSIIENYISKLSSGSANVTNYPSRYIFAP